MIAQRQTAFPYGSGSYLPHKRTSRLWVILFDCLCFTLPLGPLSTIQFMGRTPNLFWVDVMLFAMVIPWGMKQGLRIPRYALPYIGYLVWALCTAPLTHDVLSFIVVLKLRVAPFLLFLIVKDKLTSEADARHATSILMLAAGAVAAISLLAFWNISQGAAPYFLGTTPEEIRGTKDMLQTGFGRSNYIASICAIVVPLSIFLTWRARGWIKAAAGGSSLLLVTAIMVAQSRGAIISLALGSVSAAFFGFLRVDRHRRRRVWAIIEVAVVLMLLIGLWKYLPATIIDPLDRRFESLLLSNELGRYGDNRFELWAPGLAAAMDHPFLGIGLGNQFLLAGSLGMASTTHNLFLDTFLETGIVGALLLLWFLISLLLAWFRAYRRGTGGFHGEVSLAMMSVFVITMVNAFVEPSFWSPQFAYLFWAAMALAPGSRVLGHNLTTYGFAVRPTPPTY
jgi:O-antigen ligase